MSFNIFWAAWPRRVARKDAEKAWRQVDGDRHLEAILEGLAWQVVQPQWTKDEGTYIPYPATWLRGERWTDERPTPAENPHAVGGLYDQQLGLGKTR